MQFVQKYSKKNNNLDKNLLIGFSFLIIVGGILNTLSNKTYTNDSWTIGEWLINYQGGFVRRGFLGEGIYLFSTATKISNRNLTPRYDSISSTIIKSYCT